MNNNDNLNRDQSIKEIQDRITRQENGRRRKAAIRRQKNRRRNVCISIVAILILLIFIIGKISSCVNNKVVSTSNNIAETVIETTEVSTNKQNEETTKENKIIEYNIEAPQIRKKSEVYKLLKMYAKNDSKMAELYEDREIYPTDLLNKVVNNPEMTDFILGYLDAEDKVTGGFTEAEKNAEYPLLIQWDSRWAYASYGEDNIGISGCGPTCLSMVILSLTGNEKATPDKIAKFSMENGYYVEGTGTAWALMSDISEEYDVLSYQIPVDEQEMINEIDNGRMLICSVGPGDFTTGGHFIVIYGYDENGFLVNDPYCRARSEKKWTFEKLSGQIRAIWTYRRKN